MINEKEAFSAVLFRMIVCHNQFLSVKYISIDLFGEMD